MKLKEVATPRIPGPGDYWPGDELNPRSPDYNPDAVRRQQQRSSGYTTHREPDDSQWEPSPEERRAAREARQHAGKLSDIEYSEDYPNGRHMAPVTTKTGIAATAEDAQREILRMRGAAWQTFDQSVEPLPDGRVRFMVKYTM